MSTFFWCVELHNSVTYSELGTMVGCDGMWWWDVVVGVGGRMWWWDVVVGMVWYGNDLFDI